MAAVVLVAAGTFGGPRPADAAVYRPIRYPTSVPHVNAHEQSALTYYLLGGPARWATTRAPQFPANLVVTNRFGTLKDNALGEFLTWKRDQNPTLFDERHPRIAPLFTTSTLSSASVGVHVDGAPSVTKSAALETLAPPTTPAVPASTVSTPAGVKISLRLVVTPAASAEFLTVPEPPSVVSALAVLGLAGAWRAAGKRAVA